jgi:hypothetical protein
VLPKRGFADPFGLLQQTPPQTQSARLTTIQATKRTLEINGKAASVMGLLQPNGTQGMSCVVNDPFAVILENKLSVPTGNPLARFASPQ